MQQYHFIPEEVSFSVLKLIQFVLNELNIREIDGRFDEQKILTIVGEQQFDQKFHCGRSNVRIEGGDSDHETLKISYQGLLGEFKIDFEASEDCPQGVLSYWFKTDESPLQDVFESWLAQREYEHEEVQLSVEKQELDASDSSQEDEVMEHEKEEPQLEKECTELPEESEPDNEQEIKPEVSDEDEIPSFYCHGVSSNGDHYSVSVGKEGVRWGISGPPQMTMSAVGGTGGFLTFEEFVGGQIDYKMMKGIRMSELKDAKENARLKLKKRNG